MFTQGTVMLCTYIMYCILLEDHNQLYYLNYILRDIEVRTKKGEIVTKYP